MSAFPFYQPVLPPRYPQIIAHRGLKDRAPENTLPALRMAAEAGIEWAEVDLRLTRDGHHVLGHDASVDRIAAGSGRIDEMALEGIRSLDAGIRFSPEFAGTRIPTHREALEYCRGRINLYLDCKRVDLPLLVREIRESGMERQVVAFHEPGALEELRGLSGGAIAVMPSVNRNPDPGYWSECLRPAAVEIHAHLLTPGLVEAFHAGGMLVQAQTLGDRDRPETWRACMEMGVDWIQTGRPTDVADARRRHLVGGKAHPA